MAFFDYQTFHLVGIKGVALTALSECLLDAGKTVTGADVAENFVTQGILAQRGIKIQIGFDGPLPENTACVIYTAAHGGNTNPQVLAAQSVQIPTYSHAQAIAEFFNQKQGIAVCGVGGKSTTSAMITWILQKTGHNPSFAVGVGNIPGIEHTGHWSEDSTYFVAEADEYAEQPKPLDPAAQASWQLVPRFHYLKPWLTVCTNLKYDHPDVYPDFEATKQTFKAFFSQISEGGCLICNGEDKTLIADLAPSGIKIMSFGEAAGSDIQLTNYQATPGQTRATFTYDNQEFTLTLKIPGKFNVMNALAAIAASLMAGVPVEQTAQALSDFRSTMRRFELIGEKNGVTYYDDYAHHPTEVANAIQALSEWYPTQHKLIMFQSHTYSRTKQLFSEFVEAFKDAQEVVMIDIFPSARESADPSVTSDLLCQKIQEKYPALKINNVKTLDQLAQYCKDNLHPGDVAITLGAGDIYQVHQLI